MIVTPSISATAWIPSQIPTRSCSWLAARRMDLARQAVDLATHLDAVDALRAFFIFAACTVCMLQHAASMAMLSRLADPHPQFPRLASVSLHHLWRPCNPSVGTELPAVETRDRVQVPRNACFGLPSVAAGPSQLLYAVLRRQRRVVRFLGSSAPIPRIRVPGARGQHAPGTSGEIHVGEPGDGLLGVDDGPGCSALARMLGLF